MNTECHIIENAFAMINECFDRLYNNEPVKSANGWGDSTLDMINDAIRAYNDGVAQIDKRLSNLNYE